MSNDLIQSETSGAAGVGPATEDLPGGGEGHGFASGAPTAARRAEIHRIRNTDIDRYFAEGLDREELGHIKSEMGQVTPTDPMDWQESRNEMSTTPDGAKIAYEWDGMGGFKLHLGRVQERVGAMVRDLGNDRSQRVFMESFDRSLSDRARYVIYDEIAAGAPSFVTPASEADLERFGSNPVGSELLEEWGTDAPQKVAAVWRRVERLKEQLGDEANDFFTWFETLSPGQAKAIVGRVVR